MFLGWSSTKLLFFVPVGYSTWLPGPIISGELKKCFIQILIFLWWLIYTDHYKKGKICRSLQSSLLLNGSAASGKNILKGFPILGVRRLLSAVCKLFTFQASSPKPLGQLEPNLAGMFLGWSSIQ
jgi:hypothetical protein